MQKSDVEGALGRRPFLPLVIRLDDGRAIDVPFAHVAIPFAKTLLVMLGVKTETSHSATGKVEVEYARIDRIEPRRTRGTAGRKKAS